MKAEVRARLTGHLTLINGSLSSVTNGREAEAVFRAITDLAVDVYDAWLDDEGLTRAAMSQLLQVRASLQDYLRVWDENNETVTGLTTAIHACSRALMSANEWDQPLREIVPAEEAALARRAMAEFAANAPRT